MTEKDEGMEKKTKITVGGAVVVAFVVGVVVGAAGGGALTGTVETDPGGDGGAPIDPPILVEEDHDGESFDASPGQRAIVTLGEDADAGFEWEVTDDGNVTVTDSSTRQATDDASRPSHTRIVTLEIDSGGEFGMEYINPDGEVQKTFSVTFDTGS